MHFHDIKRQVFQNFAALRVVKTMVRDHPVAPPQQVCSVPINKLLSAILLRVHIIKCHEWSCQIIFALCWNRHYFPRRRHLWNNSLFLRKFGFDFKSANFGVTILVSILEFSYDNALRWMPWRPTDHKSTCVNLNPDLCRHMVSLGRKSNDDCDGWIMW